METKQFKTRKILVLLVIFALFAGCQKEFTSLDPDENLEFISIESDIDIDKLSKLEFDKLRIALSRIDIFMDDTGLYKIVQNSGQEINISDKLFNYLKETVENSNRVFKSPKNRLSIPRLKSGDEQPGGGRTDCVAQTISAISTRLGGSYGYNEIDDWITGNYGYGGVPKEAMVTVVEHFFQTCSMNYGPVNGYNYYEDTSTAVMVVIDNFDGTGHAATLISSDGILAFLRDDQNGGEAVIEAWRIMRSYKVSNPY